METSMRSSAGLSIRLLLKGQRRLVVGWPTEATSDAAGFRVDAVPASGFQVHRRVVLRRWDSGSSAE